MTGSEGRFVTVGDARLRALADRFYRHVPDEELRAHALGQLVDLVQGMRELAARRPAGQAVIEVIDPPGMSVTLVRIVTDDMPFLVDSVTMELLREGRSIIVVMHPQLVVRRDGEGRLLDVLELDVDDDRPADAIAESWMTIELDRDLSQTSDVDIVGNLTRVLGDVRAAVGDWRAMRGRAHELATHLEAGVAGMDVEQTQEAAQLLHWLIDDHFTFLGYREYALVGDADSGTLTSVPDTGLGILRQAPGSEPTVTRLPEFARERARERVPLVLTKANSRSTVHRPAYLDYVGVKRLDEHGTVIGECRFLGLYTASAVSESIVDVPVLRRRFAEVLEATAVVPGSHSAKDLQQFLETYPREELFQTHTDTLKRLATEALHLQDRRQTRLFLRPDDYGRFVSCMVFLPRDRYTTPVRLRITEVLMDAFEGVSSDYAARVGESLLARLHVIVQLPARGALPVVDERELEAAVAAAARSWDDDFQAELVRELGEADARRMLRTYAGAFPEAFKEDYPARAGVVTAVLAEGLADGEFALDLYAPDRYRETAQTDPRERRFTIIRCGAPLSLSRVLPALQLMGVEVTDERPYEIERVRRSTVWALDFGILLPDRDVPHPETLSERFSDGFRAAWEDRAEVDALNGLIVQAGLTWRQVVVLRAYVRYLRQTGSSFGQDYVHQALLSRHDIAALLVQLFEAQFDPSVAGEVQGDQGAERARLTMAIEAALETVPSLDFDRILRSIMGLIRATLRTNHYVDGAQALALKLDPSLIVELPDPRPHREIWVHAPRVEGVHLRFGPVARGGLRWSDRREDFRTEVLGLVKAQAVKNAVIVPVGAKGGFVPQRLPDPSVDRDGWLTEGKAAYRVFVASMLDVTDNLVSGEVVPPKQVVRRDGDDPYLVVAADKGTATFSDLANAIAEDYGFWLGDAFASGGSAGYDHKAMGITARGAWISVQRHFQELGVDTQRDAFTVAGIGDMSGDVFGNGMLLSDQLRLVAAFDHRHVFIDPNPDAARAFAERQRLFALPRSSWADYDPSLISAGGGVFDRAAKSIPLSPQMRDVLGIASDAEAMTPNELIRSILTAPVDLLWNGGIGTYVKSRSETNADAGDKTNDPVRVNGDELRCKVVGEGGNLGLTQLGRIEAAMCGIRLNTDAIDNSAGVDTSDHEVNIKILLDGLVREGTLPADERIPLLASMTDDVAAAVLADNVAQNIVLGTARASAPALVSVHERFIASLEEQGRLDRALERLPDPQELRIRQTAGQGLTSPELAVLLAHAKLALTAELDGTGLDADPWFERTLRSYFPSVLVDRFAGALASHPLRGPIILTVIANTTVNIGGITFVFRAMEETGASADDIVRAAVAASEIFAISDMWNAVSTSPGLSTEAQAALHLEIRRLLDRATRWLLQTRGHALDIAAEVAHLRPLVRDHAREVPDMLRGAEAERLRRQERAFTTLGAPETLAREVAALLDVYALLDIADLSRRTGGDPEALMRLYFVLSERYDVDRTLMRITALPRGDRWSALARQALRTDLYQVIAALTEQVWRSTAANLDADAKVASWEQAHLAGLARARGTFDELAGSEPDLATLSVALRTLRNLVAQGRTSADR